MKITYDDFKKVKIKVGTILEVVKNENCKEFEIFQLGQLQFINNAIYTLVVVLMTALAFYLIN